MGTLLSSPCNLLPAPHPGALYAGQGYTVPASALPAAVTSEGHTGISFVRVVGSGGKTAAHPGGSPGPAQPPSFSQCGGAIQVQAPPAWGELCPSLSLPSGLPAPGFATTPAGFRSPVMSMWAWGLGPGFVQARALSPLAGFFPPCWTHLAAWIWRGLSREPCFLGAFNRGPVCWEVGG